MKNSDYLSALEYFKSVIEQSLCPKESDQKLVLYQKNSNQKLEEDDFKNDLVITINKTNNHNKILQKLTDPDNQNNETFFVSFFGIYDNFFKKSQKQNLDIIFFPCEIKRIHVDQNKKAKEDGYWFDFTDIPVLNEQAIFEINQNYNIDLQFKSIIEKYNNFYDLDHGGLYDVDQNNKNNERKINKDQYKKMINKLFKELNNKLENTNKSIQSSWHLAVYQSNMIAKTLVNKYQQSISYYSNNQKVIENNLKNTAFKNYIDPNFKQINSMYESYNLENRVLKKSESHDYGQLTFKCKDFENNELFGLNFNQKTFLYYACNDSYNENIMALNGPPGTGKTTVMQDYVASQVVHNFLDYKNNPDIIVGVSATNQAKNNLIEGFKKNNKTIMPSKLQISPFLYQSWTIPTKRNKNNDYKDPKNANLSFKDRMIKLSDEQDSIYSKINYGIPLNNEPDCFKDRFKEIFDAKNINEAKSDYVNHFNDFKNTINNNFLDELALVFNKTINKSKELKKLETNTNTSNLDNIISSLHAIGLFLKQELNDFENKKITLIDSYNPFLLQELERKKKSKKKQIDSIENDYQQAIQTIDQQKEQNKKAIEQKYKQYQDDMAYQKQISQKIQSNIKQIEQISQQWHDYLRNEPTGQKIKSWLFKNHYKKIALNMLDQYKIDHRLKETIQNHIEYNQQKQSITQLLNNVLNLDHNPNNLFSFDIQTNKIAFQSNCQSNKDCLNSIDKLLNQNPDNLLNDQQKEIKQNNNYFDKQKTQQEQKKQERIDAINEAIVDLLEQTKQNKKIIEFKNHLINIKPNSMFQSNIGIMVGIIESIQQTDHFETGYELKKQLFVQMTALIDNTIKYTLFNLAMRYFEGQFLKQATEEVINKEKTNKDQLIVNQNQNRKKGFESFKKQYELLSCLCPVMVSTAHSMLTNFSATQFNNGVFKGFPMTGFIDTIIFDEAGQCAPEIGALPFTLTKQAIVVGDTQQIPPVWNIEEDLDQAYQKKYFGINNNEKIKPLSCSDSNVMAIAQKETALRQVDQNNNLADGFYLLEHRRCPNQIIQYANELKYDNKLILLPEKDYYNIPNEKLYLPNQKPWLLIDTNNINEFISSEMVVDKAVENDEENGKSRKNTKEAQYIVNYLEDNLNYIEQSNQKIKDVIAVLTPFKAQADTIKKLINTSKNKEQFKGITCGTVHSLQGAEKPIILFSFVYTQNDNVSEYFIDRNDNIINVGVSRAKQSFYVFGDQQAIVHNQGKATSLLSRFLNDDHG